MGFYGDITDTSRAQFQFDKIFKSRYEMDRAATLGSDNVFSGRFVLVKYDAEMKYFVSEMLLGFLNPSDGHIYQDRNFRYEYIYTTFSRVDNPVASDWSQYYYFDGKYYLKLPSMEYFVEGNLNYYTANYTPPEDSEQVIVGLNSVVRLRDSASGELTSSYYNCIGTTPGELADWEELTTDEDWSDYIVNYQIDQEQYGDAFDVRGYDATVWQKVYSEGYGRFIMVARLNGGLLPVIELYPDPPMQKPNSPYIHTLSTESWYRINVPTKYGFQIKPVDISQQPALSDQRALVNTVTYDELQDEYVYSLEEINAAIYYNKAASNKIYRSMDLTTANEITIEPTGESGRTYLDRDGHEVTKDILELTVHLPAIGNMIADGYDLIYGYNTTLNAEGKQTRPTDIDWIDGSESDNYKFYGNQLNGGKTHNLSTLAGTLNELHDRLGQIIVHTDTLPAPEQMSSNLIYENGGKYYRRGTGSDPDPVPESSYSYTYVPGINSSNFEFNKYYVYSSNTIPEGVTPTAATEYVSGQYYFIKNLTGARYHEIALESYTPSTFYRKLGEDYLRDNASPYPSDNNSPYYRITSTTSYHFDAAYTNDGRFFTLDSTTGIFTPSLDSVPTQGVTYYVLKNIDGTYVANNIVTKRYYHPGVYCYLEHDVDTDTDVFVLDFNNYATSLRRYYIPKFSSIPQYGLVNGQLAEYYEMIGDPTYVGGLEDPPSNVEGYYFVNGSGQLVPYTYLAQMENVNGASPYTIVRTYYQINTSENYTDDLYLPNLYYTRDTDTGDYLKSSSWGGRTVTYYILNTVTQVENPFYLPNIYYYEVSTDNFALATEDTKVHNKYYTKTRVFVDVDTLQQCPHGYEWNDYSPYIPPSISLYYRNEVPNVVEIKGISNGNASVNGAILNLHKEYDFEDVETRNEKTFRGCLNQLNDMLYRIKELRPGYMLTVNNFGQIVSMSLEDLKAKLNAIS